MIVSFFKNLIILYFFKLVWLWTQLSLCCPWCLEQRMWFEYFYEETGSDDIEEEFFVLRKRGQPVCIPWVHVFAKAVWPSHFIIGFGFEFFTLQSYACTFARLQGKIFCRPHWFWSKSCMNIRESSLIFICGLQ